MVPPLFGVLLITFVVTQFVLEGPKERMIAQLDGHCNGGKVPRPDRFTRGTGGWVKNGSPQLEKHYGFDIPACRRFVDMMRDYLVLDFGLYRLCNLHSLGIRKAVHDGLSFDVLSSTVNLSVMQLFCRGNSFMVYHGPVTSS